MTSMRACWAVVAWAAGLAGCASTPPSSEDGLLTAEQAAALGDMALCEGSGRAFALGLVQDFHTAAGEIAAREGEREPGWLERECIVMAQMAVANVEREAYEGARRRAIWARAVEQSGQDMSAAYRQSAAVYGSRVQSAPAPMTCVSRPTPDGRSVRSVCN